MATRLKQRELKTLSHSWRLERFKCISGRGSTLAFFDTETLARLISLLERYRPEALAEIEDFPTL